MSGNYMSMPVDKDIVEMYNYLVTNSVNGKSPFAILKIYLYSASEVFDSDMVMSKLRDQVQAHNLSFMGNGYCDSGFDVITPFEVNIPPGYNAKMIDMQIKTEMLYCDVATDKITPTGYFAFPRSSISKTPLMLANHTGIIDSGYRGTLRGAFRNLSDEVYVVPRLSRLLQLCHPTLCPVYVHITDEKYLTSTLRNEGGFGSTGV